MAKEVASLVAVFEAETSKFTAGTQNVRNQLNAVSVQALNTSSVMQTALGVGAVAAVGRWAAGGVQSAASIETAFKNVQSVTGETDAQIAAIQSRVMAIGRNSTMGIHAVAGAYYEVASGVGEASARIPVLEAAVSLAQAGNADLTVSTKGLIAAVNAYTPAVLSASDASNVYSRVTQMGVGSMEEFVAAINPVAGLAAAVSVSFEELGAASAFLTAKGSSPARAATQLQSIISAFLKPNQDMTAGLRDMGFQSGEAALAQLGLAGAVQGLNDAMGGSTDAMAQALGTVEALQGAVQLTSADWSGFQQTFNRGLDGSTQRAMETNLDSVEARWARINSRVEGYQIAIGQLALPVLDEGLQGFENLLNVGEAVFGGTEKFNTDAQAALDAALTQAPAVTQMVDITFKPGDTVWSISQELGIDRQAIIDALAAQGITDATQIPSGVSVQVGIEVEGVPTMGMAEFSAFNASIQRNTIEIEQSVGRLDIVSAAYAATVNELSQTILGISPDVSSGAVAGINDLSGALGEAGFMAAFSTIGLNMLLGTNFDISTWTTSAQSFQEELVKVAEAGDSVVRSIGQFAGLDSLPIIGGLFQDEAPADAVSAKYGFGDAAVPAGGDVSSVMGFRQSAIDAASAADAQAISDVLDGIYAKSETPLIIQYVDQTGVNALQSANTLNVNLNTATRPRTAHVTITWALLMQPGGLAGAAADAAEGAVVPGLAAGAEPRAGGGPVLAGNTYRINEHGLGSELFVPAIDGQMVPMHQLDGGSGGSAQGQPVIKNYNFYGAVYGQSDLLAILKQADSESAMPMWGS